MSVLRKHVHIRSLNFFVAIRSHATQWLLIGHDKKYVGLQGLFIAGTTRQQQGQDHQDPW